MTSYLDLDMLSTMVRNKRANRNLREISKEIGGVSPSTLSRVENGKTPDMEIFLRLCDWLEVPVTTFIKSADEEQEKGESEATSSKLAAQLRADRNLSPATANALAAIVKAAYRELANQNKENEK
jgi:transcriptional regulator with XRE-family HTH domain